MMATEWSPSRIRMLSFGDTGGCLLECIELKSLQRWMDLVTHQGFQDLSKSAIQVKIWSSIQQSLPTKNEYRPEEIEVLYILNFVNYL